MEIFDRRAWNKPRGLPASAQEPAGLTGTSRRTEETDCQLQRRIWFHRAGAGDSACLTCSQVTSKLLHLLVCRETYTSARIGPLERKFLRLSETRNHVGRLLAPPTDTLRAWGPGTSPSGVWGPELTWRRRARDRPLTSRVCVSGRAPDLPPYATMCRRSRFWVLQDMLPRWGQLSCFCQKHTSEESSSFKLSWWF